jgi:hypothetical protein
MINAKNVICQDFENEMWLYITEELPKERMGFWKAHLLSCDKCTLDLQDELTVTSIVKKETTVDLNDSLFDEMINATVLKKKNWIGNIIRYRFNYAENKSVFGKAALIGVFATTAIIVLLITHQSIPIPVKSIPKDILDWEGTKVTAQINELKKTINMIHEDNWDQQMMMFDQRMKALEKASDKFSFN